MNGEASKIVAHAEKLDDHTPSSLEQDVFCPWPFSMYDAPGCVNTLELDIRHA